MSTYKSLTVESLIIQDPRSKKHFHLSASGITFRGSKGDLRLDIDFHHSEIFGDIPTIESYDSNGQTRIKLGVERIGCPYFSLKDGNGQSRVHGCVGEDGWAEVVLMDGAGTDRLKLIVNEDNEPSLRIAAKADRTRILLECDIDGEPSFALYDDKGQKVEQPAFATKEGD
jgi:hypothetical protein